MKPQSSPSQVYYVRATSIPNRYYAVGEFPGTRQVFRCECKAGQFGRRCWHVEAVVAGAVKPARLKGAAPAAPDAHRAALLARVDALLAGTPAPTAPPVPAPEHDHGFIPMPGFISPNREQRRPAMTPERRAALESLYA